MAKKKSPFGQAMAPKQRLNLEPRDPDIDVVPGDWNQWSMGSPEPLLPSSRTIGKPDYMPKRDAPVIVGLDAPMTAPAIAPIAPPVPAPPWQQQAANTFSFFGRNVPFRDMATNTPPLPADRRLAPLGIGRDRLAEYGYAGKVRGINRPADASGAPLPLRQPVVPPMRSPTVENPATPAEIQRAFHGPVNFAPGGTPARAAAAQGRLSRNGGGGLQTTQEDLDSRGALVNAFRSGDFSGTDAGQFARPAELDAISRLIQSARGQNPSRPDISVPAAGPGEPGFGESYYAGQSNVTVPGVGRRASNQSLGSRRIGAGIQSTGMTTGGGFGSPLMTGGGALPAMLMGGMPERQQPELVSRPMQGQTEVTPSQFAEAWKNRKMTTGEAPDLDKMQKRRDALAARQAAVEARGKARGESREERMQFARDRQYFGDRGALIRAFARQGMDPERAMAMMQGNMQWLSEDNRQRRAADEFGRRSQIESDRELREQLQMRWTPRLAEAQAILNNPAATITEKNRAKQIMDEYDRSLTTAFGAGPALPAATTPAPAATAGPQSAPEGTVPFGSGSASGVMVDPMAMPQLQAIAANYSQNPAQVGQQLVQMLNTPSFAHLSTEEKNKILQQITGNPRATITSPGAQGVQYDPSTIGSMSIGG